MVKPRSKRAKNGREQILISEIPFNVNRAELIKRIAGLIQEKVITDISDVRDLSDENTRIELELKRDANSKVVLNNLYMHTAMESSFAVNMLAIDHGRPKLLSLKEALHCYIEHRRDVVLRRTRFLLRQAEARAETLEGYLIALANLDDFIDIIRRSANREEAKIKLLAYEFGRETVEQIGIRIRSESPVGRWPVYFQRTSGGPDSRSCVFTNSPDSSAKKSSMSTLKSSERLMIYSIF